MAKLDSEVQKLSDYFASDGWSRFGFHGDEHGLSPADCAIEFLREYDALCATTLGEKALNAMLYAELVRKGLVPA